MKRLLFLPFALLLILSSCEEAVECEISQPNSSPNTIMALGASRVEGARPSFESFRFELWKQLIDGGWEFDYIGTKCDESSYPVYAGQMFDIHHEGRGGWTSGQILNGLSSWLETAGAPDIVLFSSPGGNDALQDLSYPDAVEQINAIIDILQEANPNVIIILEQTAPAVSERMVPPLSTWFEQMQEEVLTIAQNQTDGTSRVIAVDMYTGFSDALLADDVHYNEAGAKFIADRYYTLLVDLLE